MGGEENSESAKAAPREREQIPKDLEFSVDFEEIDDMLEKGLEGSVKSYRCLVDDCFVVVLDYLRSV